jgi:hypothetical protein
MFFYDRLFFEHPDIKALEGLKVWAQERIDKQMKDVKDDDRPTTSDKASS